MKVVCYTCLTEIEGGTTKDKKFFCSLKCVDEYDNNPQKNREDNPLKKGIG